MSNYQPKGLTFESNGREMMLVYDNEPRVDMRGWILYKHPDGQWVSLRKATDADISTINEAVSRSFHEVTA